MGLEVGTYISDLVATNPNGATDDAGTIDDHIRLIKTVLKNTIPFDEEVVVSAAELNYLDGATSNIQSQIDLKYDLGNVVANSEFKTNSDSDLLVNKSNFFNNALFNAASGYYTLPAGLCIQWGSETLSAGTNELQEVVFPLAFSAVYFCNGQIYSNVATDVVSNITTLTMSGFFFKYTSATSRTGRWIAVGLL